MLRPEEHAACAGTCGKKDEKLTCRYCEALLAILFAAGDGPRQPPFVLVRHSAHVAPSFDLETNISEARIDNYQFLAPKSLALSMLRAAHPLDWYKAAPDIFQQSDPAFPREDAEKNRFFSVIDAATTVEARAAQVTDWQSKATPGPGYIQEAVKWPWSDVISFDVRNIIRISDFKIEGFALLDDAAAEDEAMSRVTTTRSSLANSAILAFSLSMVDWTSTTANTRVERYWAKRLPRPMSKG